MGNDNFERVRYEREDHRRTAEENLLRLLSSDAGLEAVLDFIRAHRRIPKPGDAIPFSGDPRDL